MPIKSAKFFCSLSESVAILSPALRFRTIRAASLPISERCGHSISVNVQCGGLEYQHCVDTDTDSSCKLANSYTELLSAREPRLTTSKGVTQWPHHPGKQNLANLPVPGRGQRSPRRKCRKAVDLNSPKVLREEAAGNSLKEPTRVKEGRARRNRDC